MRSLWALPPKIHLAFLASCSCYCAGAKNSWLIPMVQKLCHHLANLHRCRPPSANLLRPQGQHEHAGVAADGIWLPRWAQTTCVAIPAMPAKSAAKKDGNNHVFLPLPTPIAPIPTQNGHSTAAKIDCHGKNLICKWYRECSKTNKAVCTRIVPNPPITRIVPNLPHLLCAIYNSCVRSRTAVCGLGPT